MMVEIMGRRLTVVLAAVLLLGLGISEAAAVPTTVVIRAKAKDAKFIGSSMGGARVRIKDSRSGELIREGMISGGTGDTQAIMVHPTERGKSLSDSTAAKFETVIDLKEPRRVVIEVDAPMTPEHSRLRSSTEVWLLPGKDIVGDGLVVEVPGFSVEILSPLSSDRLTLVGGSLTLSIRAHVVMMCGCPIEPGGLWDAEGYEIQAWVKRGDLTMKQIPLRFTGQKSTFEGVLEVTEEGEYEISAYAFDPVTGNTGLDRSSVRISK